MRIGLVAALPPPVTGPADYARGLVPHLARRASLVCLVEDVARVDDAIRSEHEVRPIEERSAVDVDLLLYQVANSPDHFGVIRAALDGPPGVIVLHDASIHHVYVDRLLNGGDPEGYRDRIAEAHGELGRRIAGYRLAGEGGQTELFLFDALRPLLERSLGVIVHSDYCRALVEHRVPKLPVWTIPHYAPGSVRGASRAQLGLPEDKVLVGHLGFVTPPKRPELLLRSVARLGGEGIDLHVVFAGEDQTWGPLDDEIGALGLRDRVTVTGFLSAEDLDRYAAAVDIVVSLRWPHVGETSGTLMRALRAGRPVIVQDLGPWAELPDDAVVRIGAGGDEVAELASALRALATDQLMRRRVGAAAAAYARDVGGADRAAESYVAVARTVVERRPGSRHDVLARRARAVTEHLERVPDDRWLSGLPPAPPGATMLGVGLPFPLRERLAGVWGYDVVEGDPAGLGDHPAASFDAVLSGADDLSERTLAAINRVLAAEGLLVAGAGTALPDALERTGFSADPGGEALVARKVTLPELGEGAIPS